MAVGIAPGNQRPARHDDGQVRQPAENDVDASDMTRSFNGLLRCDRYDGPFYDARDRVQPSRGET